MNNDINCRVIKWDVDWLEIKNLCRGTANMKDSKIEPTSEWKRKLLMAEHSPLRHSLITIEISGIPYCNMGHFVRHSVGVTPYVSSSRPDRSDVADRSERKQTDPVTMRMDLNIQSLINISRKRLCNQSDPVTRQIWQSVIDEVAKYDEDIAWACVPEGIHVASCPESFGNCKKCLNFLDSLSKEELLDMKTRLEKYQEHKEKTRKK